MDLRQKVILGLRWSAGARFLSQLLTWTITIIVMRLLTPEDYGLMAMAGIFVGYLAMLNELGLGAAVIQTHDLDETSLRAVFAFLLIISFSLFLFLFLVAPFIAAFFNEQRVVPIIRVLSTQFIVTSFAIIPQSLLQREMYFKKTSIVDFASAMAGSVTTLMLALNGWGVWSLVWGTMAINVCRTAGLNFFSPYLRVPRLSFKGMGQILSFGGYVTINRTLWFFFTQVDILIVGKLLGKELLGVYSVAMNLASLPMEKVSGLINQVAFSAFSRIQTDHQKVGSYFLKEVRVMSFFAFPVLWGISSIAPELVASLLGDKWHLSTVPLQLLCVVIPIRMIANLMNPAVMAIGRPDISFFNILSASVAIPIGIMIGVHWGLLGVCLAWVIVFPLVFLYNLSRVVTVLRIRLLDVLSTMARPALAASTMYASIMAFKMLFGTNVESIVNLVLLIIGGAMVYGGMVITFHRHGCREVLGLIRV